MVKLATPISHLFESKKCRDIIIESSDCLECRDRSIDSIESKQELFHCELQPIHEWGNGEYDYLERIYELKQNLRLVTFHIASSCDDPITVNNRFELGGKQYEEAEMLTNSEYNISIVKEIFGPNVKIAVENNNYYPTEAYKHITDAQFISKLVYMNDIDFLFDIAHAKVTCFNKNINYERYKRELPLDRVIQLHICSYAVNNMMGQAYDAHNYPDEEEFLEVDKIISEFKSVKYLTVEYYRDIERLEISLQKVRGLI